MSPRSADPTEDGVGKYLTLVLLVATRCGNTHVRIRPEGSAAIVQFWDDAAWCDQVDIIDRSLPLHMHLMRKLATMMSGILPPPGKQLHGAFMLQRPDAATLYVHAVIDHDFELVATIELVDEATYSTRPVLPPQTA